MFLYVYMQAEIQNIGADGTISLHTRSLKYGKLENGQLVVVSAALIPRLPSVTHTYTHLYIHILICIHTTLHIHLF